MWSVNDLMSKVVLVCAAEAARAKKLGTPGTTTTSTGNDGGGGNHPMNPPKEPASKEAADEDASKVASKDDATDATPATRAATASKPMPFQLATPSTAARRAKTSGFVFVVRGSTTACAFVPGTRPRSIGHAMAPVISQTQVCQSCFRRIRRREKSSFLLFAQLFTTIHFWRES